MRGLITRDVKDYNGLDKRSVLLGNTVLAKWKDIEPEEGRISEDFVEMVRSYGQVNLRILGGYNAPTWLDVNKFTYIEGVSGVQYSMPYWWDEEYMTAWDVLNLRLANLLGPFVDTIHLTGGGTLYAEPFIRSIWANKDTMPIGGDRDLEALFRMHVQQQAAWKYNNSALSLHPHQYLNNLGRPRSSLDAAMSHALEVAPTYVGAHNLRENPTSAMLDQWDALAQLPFSVYFQTANPKQIGDWRLAMARGLTYHPQFVELNKDLDTYDVEDMVTYTHAMENRE